MPWSKLESSQEIELILYFSHKNIRNWTHQLLLHDISVSIMKATDDKHLSFDFDWEATRPTQFDFLHKESMEFSSRFNFFTTWLT